MFPFRLFQGQTVQHNHKAGVIMSSSNLALQGITRHQAGNYTCIASNVEGDGESPVYPLKVMCKLLAQIRIRTGYSLGLMPVIFMFPR